MNWALVMSGDSEEEEMGDCDCDDMVWRGLGDPCRCPPFGVAMRVVESSGGGVLTAFGAGTWLGWAPSVGGRRYAPATTTGTVREEPFEGPHQQICIWMMTVVRGDNKKR